MLLLIAAWINDPPATVKPAATVAFAAVATVAAATPAPASNGPLNGSVARTTSPIAAAVIPIANAVRQSVPSGSERFTGLFPQYAKRLMLVKSLLAPRLEASSALINRQIFGS